MYRHRAIIFTSLYLYLICSIGFARAANVVEMCGDISEVNELQISVECLESLVGLEDNTYREPKEFMAALQRVEKLIQVGETLSSDENILWVMVRDKMRNMVLGGMTRGEFLTKVGDSAVCAIVLALGYKYGFCAYLHSLGLSQEQFISARTVLLSSTVRTTNDTSIGSTEVTLVIHLDLFNMQCNPAALQALCSEYVRIIFNIILAWTFTYILTHLNSVLRTASSRYDLL